MYVKAVFVQASLQFFLSFFYSHSLCSIFNGYMPIHHAVTITKSAPLAQLVEQLTLNQWVRGSSPRRCTSDESRKPSNEGKVSIFTQRVHLFPFRTQKLSFAVPTILAWRRAGKIGHGRYPASRIERDAPKREWRRTEKSGEPISP